MRVETTQQVEHLAWLGDGMAKIAKNVGEVLELAAVVVDAQVALLQGTEFGFDEDGAVHLIVAEQALDGVPDGERRRARLVDEVEHLGVHRGLEPIDHAVVVEDPFGVALVEGQRREDVGCEAELPENGVEAAAPLAVIGLLEAEGDGDVGADVDLLDDGRWSRWDGDIAGVVRGGRGVARGGHGCGR